MKNIIRWIASLIQIESLARNKDSVSFKRYMQIAQSFIVRISGIGANFILGIMLARTHGATVVGDYYGVLGAALIISSVMLYGYDQIALRVIARSAGQVNLVSTRRWIYVDVIRHWLQPAFLALALLAAIVSAHFFGMAFISSAFGVATALVVVQINAAIAQGAGKPSVTVFGMNVAISLFSLLLLPLLGARPHLMLIASSICAAVLMHYAVRKEWHAPMQHVTSGVDVPSSADILTERSAAPRFMLNTLAMQAMTWTPVLVLYVLLGKSPAGDFAVASRLSNVVTIGLMLGSFIVSSEIGRAYSSGDWRAMRASFSWALWTGAAAAAIPFVAIILGRNEIANWYKISEASLAPLFVLLAIGQLVNAFTGPAALILSITREESRLRDTNIAYAIVEILVVAIAVLLGGAFWAAAAFVLVQAAQNITLLYFARRTLRLMKDASVYRPNLYLVGAPKCGTTSLYRWLGMCSDVYCPEVKEPSYWSFGKFWVDANGKRYTTEQDYLLEYRSGKAARYRVDASTTYLRDEHALRRIKSACAEVKILVCIRDLAELVASLHQEELYSGVEREEDLLRAWQRRAEEVPSSDRGDAFKLDYHSIAAVGTQLHKVIEIFGADSVLVISLDELATDTESVQKRLEGFLGIDIHEPGKFHHANARKELRYARVVRFIWAPRRRLVQDWLRAIKFVAAILGLRSRLVRSLTQAAADQKPRDAVMSQIRSDLHEEAALLTLAVQILQTGGKR